MQNLVVDYNFNLNDNMDAVKDDIVKSLEKYSGLVVTEETVKDAKKLMADINKQKKDFTDVCKNFLDEIEKPIKEFKNKKKEIEALYDNVRASIKAQVDTYEAKRLAITEKVIKDYINDVCNTIGIDANAIGYKDLIKLTALTSTGKLAKSTKDAIDNRIAIVEAEILRAKVEEAERQKKIQEEAERIARQRERELIEQKERELQIARQNAELEKKKALEEQAKEIKNNTPAETPAPKVVAKKDEVVVGAYFRIKVRGDKVTNDMITSRLAKILADAGITSLEKIEVISRG